MSRPPSGPRPVPPPREDPGLPIPFVGLLGVGLLLGLALESLLEPVRPPLQQGLRCAAALAILGPSAVWAVARTGCRDALWAFVYAATAGVAAGGAHLETALIGLIVGLIAARRARARPAAAASSQQPPRKSRKSAAQANPLEGLGSEYVMERLLGEGGMGQVHLVRSQASGERFAVKTARFADETSRCNFLTELQTWINLPDHPNLARCGFLRTAGDRTMIFAEYVDGGSLSDWIRSGRLYEGGTGKAIERILDVAIQFAWGLHASHESGVVHQDVKPGNVLMTSDGIAKVADFGLARARFGERDRDGAGAGPAPGPADPRFTVRGMSPAYCSPEQSQKLPVGRTTDVWSWGLSILEMFAGGLCWSTGVAARFALQDQIEAGPADPSIPAIPPALAKVLDRCFAQEPARRYQTMREAAHDLLAIHRDMTGRDYPRTEPVTGEVVQAAPPASPSGAGWTAPRDWLKEVWRELGQESRIPIKALPVRGGSARARAVADLAGFELAREGFERLLAAGRPHATRRLIALLEEKASVHEFLGDLKGAVGLHERIIELATRTPGTQDGLVLARAHRKRADGLRRTSKPREALDSYARALALVERPGDPAADVALERVAVLRGQALASDLVGDTGDAIASFDRAIDLCHRLVGQGAGEKTVVLLAEIVGEKGRTLESAGRSREAIVACDTSLGLCRRLATDTSPAGPLAGLARATILKASILQGLGRCPEAVALLTEPLAGFDHLVRQKGREELSVELAQLLLARSLAALDVRDLDTAVRTGDVAVELAERLVLHQGRLDLADLLAAASLARCRVYLDRSQTHDALRLIERAVKLLDGLVNEEGRRGLAVELASTLETKGQVLLASAQPQAAAQCADRALGILEDLIESGERRLALAQARVWLLRASASLAAGDEPEALSGFDRAIELCEKRVLDEGRTEATPDLAHACASKAEVLARSGKAKAALALCRSAVELQERHLKATGGNPKPADQLARILLTQASVEVALGETAAADETCGRAIALWEDLVKKGLRQGTDTGLFKAFTLRANVVLARGRVEESMRLHDEAKRWRTG